MSEPVFVGSSQLTVTLLVEAPVTDGAAGASGGSSTSVTLIVTPWVTSTLPSFTVTTAA